MALQLAASLYVAVSLGRAAEGSSRAILAVTMDALVRRSTVFATCQRSAPAASKASASTKESMVALSGLGIPAAPMAPLFSALLTRAAAVELNRADLTVSSWTPEVSLLTIMAARLGGHARRIEALERETSPSD